MRGQGLLLHQVVELYRGKCAVRVTDTVSETDPTAPKLLFIAQLASFVGKQNIFAELFNTFTSVVKNPDCAPRVESADFVGFARTTPSLYTLFSLTKGFFRP